MNSMNIATQVRVRALSLAHNSGIGHPGGDLSCADILAVLFSDILDPWVHGPANPDRNRFILSKGHAALAYYSTLEQVDAGLVPDLDRFACFGSNYSAHPASGKLRFVEASTGPLGHGLP